VAEAITSTDDERLPHTSLMSTNSAAPKIFCDDTPLPVLDRTIKRTRIARLWSCAMDDRPWCGPGHPRWFISTPKTAKAGISRNIWLVRLFDVPLPAEAAGRLDRHWGSRAAPFGWRAEAHAAIKWTSPSNLEQKAAARSAGSWEERR
jgi:hypothetical protein